MPSIQVICGRNENISLLMELKEFSEGKEFEKISYFFLGDFQLEVKNINFGDVKK
jgi:hypothetical protein